MVNFWLVRTVKACAAAPLPKLTISVVLIFAALALSCAGSLTMLCCSLISMLRALGTNLFFCE